MWILHCNSASKGGKTLWWICPWKSSSGFVWAVYCVVTVLGLWSSQLSHRKDNLTCLTCSKRLNSVLISVPHVIVPRWHQNVNLWCSQIQSVTFSFQRLTWMFYSLLEKGRKTFLFCLSWLFASQWKPGCPQVSTLYAKSTITWQVHWKKQTRAIYFPPD